MLLDAAAAAGVEAVDDCGREHHEEETEDDCAAREFHTTTVRVALGAVCEGWHRGSVMRERVVLVGHDPAAVLPAQADGQAQAAGRVLAQLLGGAAPQRSEEHTS